MKKILILLLAVFAISCNPDISQVQKVKTGMSTNELKYLLGEPFDIEVHNGYEDWYFNYIYNGHNDGFMVTVQNSKVTDFYSY
jgi:outer membrane protein assembly factor BamE (lipoprotein component of BamABCDE complex)